MVFDLKYNWLYTEYEVARTEVPQNVMDALAASPYKDFHIDDIDCYETKTPKTPSYYRFELAGTRIIFCYKIFYGSRKCVCQMVFGIGIVVYNGLENPLKPNIRMLPGSPGRKKASTVWPNSGLTTKKHTPGLTHPENGI